MDLSAHLEDQHGAELMAFGPVQLVESFGQWPVEYAAMRQRVGLMHLAHKAILRLTGADRLDFLHRLMTQNLALLTPGTTARAMQLNVKGRIVADVWVMHRQDDTLVECDAFDFDALHALLDARLFVEDVQLHDEREAWCVMHAVGPAAMKLVSEAASSEAVAVDALKLAEAGTVHDVTIASAACVAGRLDVGTVQGVRVAVPRDEAARVYDALLKAMGYTDEASEPDAAYAERRRASLRGHPVGWSAYNTLRIEEGVPLFHIDYGNDSLPNETGVMSSTVSFTAGCYLGQEVVVRIKDLGHPKRVLVKVAFEGEHLPTAGAQLFVAEEDEAGSARTGKEVGAVTSSTPSPLAGQGLIGLAVLKWSQRAAGTVLLAPAQADLQGTLVRCVVQA